MSKLGKIIAVIVIAGILVYAVSSFAPSAETTSNDSTATNTTSRPVTEPTNAANNTYDDAWIREALSAKQDAVPGKGLSTADFTTEEKEKLSDLEVGYSAFAGDLKNHESAAVNARYLARTSGGDADIGTGRAEITKIKGNSIIWNQLIASMDSSYWASPLGQREFDSESHSTTYTWNGTSSNAFRLVSNTSTDYSITIIPSHKYYYKMDVDFDFQSSTPPAFQSFRIAVYPTGDSTVQFIWIDATKYSNGSNSIHIEGIYITTSGLTTATTGRFMVSPSLSDTSLLQENDSVTYSNLQLSDLTAMFGAGNEPATVDEFKALFPLDWYDYNAGEIVNFRGTTIKSVGFNAYNAAISKAALLGGNKYQISGNYTSLAYETVSGGNETITPDSEGLFTPVKSGTLTVTGGGADTCVHLVWSGYRNGQFEEYSENTLTLPVFGIRDENYQTLFSDGLCSVGDVYDEITATKAIKRIGSRAYASGDETDTSVLTDGTTSLYVLDSPVTVVFDAALDLTYNVDDFGTERVTYTDKSAPINCEVVYALNAVDTVRRLPANYISKKSFDNFITSFVAAMSSIGYNMSIMPEFDADGNVYDYTITLSQINNL